MGVGVSNWRLAKAVSTGGEMGVVSGTALDCVFIRRLQLGDLDGNIRRALSCFPWQGMVKRALDAYFIEGGKAPEVPYKNVPWVEYELKQAAVDRLILCNFVEIFLAKEGHSNPVGINYLEKIQLPTLPSLLGAMMAGVDYVCMGGGIPLAIPGILDRLANWEPVELPLHVEDNPDQVPYDQKFDPKQWAEDDFPELKRPRFIAVISSDIVAKSMIRRAGEGVFGFVVEDHTAGGHNAPPRRADSQPKEGVSPYGEKDIPDLVKIKNLGRPFWLAGGCAAPEKLQEALAAGALGIQVGTAFGCCRESGIAPEIRRAILQLYLSGNLAVRTDMNASPTGYPFKVLPLQNTLGHPDVAEHRRRVCDLGYLRQYYHRAGMPIGYRCPGEPAELFVKKGGDPAKAEGKLCLCNGLLATIGLAQVRGENTEPPLITAGEDFTFVDKLVKDETLDYTAADVIAYLKG